MKGLLIQLKQSALFLSLLTLVSSLVYIIVCLNSTFIDMEIESDKLDYILPFILIIIVFYNFKYYYIKEEAYYYKSLPITFKKVFINKYLLSIIHTLIVYIVLLIVTGILVIYSDRDLRSIKIINYIINIIIKMNLCILIINFLLFFITLKKKLISKILLYVSLVFSVFLFNLILLSLLEFKLNSIAKIIIFPFNSFDFLSLFLFQLSSKKIINIDNFYYCVSLFLTITILFILTFITFKQDKNIKLEDFK